MRPKLAKSLLQPKHMHPIPNYPPRSERKCRGRYFLEDVTVAEGGYIQIWKKGALHRFINAG